MSDEWDEEKLTAAVFPMFIIHHSASSFLCSPLAPLGPTFVRVFEIFSRGVKRPKVGASLSVLEITT